MGGRTIAVGDIHGDLQHLLALVDHLPTLDAGDTLVFVGDYVDRGPQSAQVVEFLRHELPKRFACKLVCLRGNHEDAWLKVRRQGWVEFVLPASNGCLPTVRSYGVGKPSTSDDFPTREEMEALFTGSFFPQDVVDWMQGLPVFYEDEHAIYVHAGVPRLGERWAHPSELEETKPLMWQRSPDFFRGYDGKRLVFGHTVAEALPQELSQMTPGNASDAFVSEHLIGIDTSCGNGGYLTAVELPSLTLYESRKYL